MTQERPLSDPKDQPGYEAFYAFCAAVQGRDYASAARMLADDPSLIAARDRLGETALHSLAVENDAAAVAWLFARGASLDTKNAFGTPVIFELAFLRNEELVRWFHQNGADFDAINEDGLNLISFLIDSFLVETAQFVESLLAW